MLLMMRSIWFLVIFDLKEDCLEAEVAAVLFIELLPVMFPISFSFLVDVLRLLGDVY